MRAFVGEAVVVGFRFQPPLSPGEEKPTSRVTRASISEPSGAWFEDDEDATARTRLEQHALCGTKPPACRASEACWSDSAEDRSGRAVGALADGQRALGGPRRRPHLSGRVGRARERGCSACFWCQVVARLGMKRSIRGEQPPPPPKRRRAAAAAAPKTCSADAEPPRRPRRPAPRAEGAPTIVVGRARTSGQEQGPGQPVPRIARRCSAPLGHSSGGRPSAFRLNVVVGHSSLRSPTVQRAPGSSRWSGTCGSSR